MALGYLWYKVFLRVIKCYKGVEMGWKEKQRGVAEKAGGAWVSTRRPSPQGIEVRGQLILQFG